MAPKEQSCEGHEDIKSIDMLSVLAAAGSGQTEPLVGMLKHARESLEFTTPSSEALLYAASAGHLGTVKALISECGANVKHVSENGWTATMYAARNGHTEAVVALVNEYSASPDHETSVGRTAIMYAASHGHAETAVALVEECGADPQHGDARGWNAIMYAYAAGHSATARLLEDLRNTAPVSAEKDTGTGAIPPSICTESSSHKRKECAPSEAPPVQKGDKVTEKVTELNTASPKRNSGARVISSHLPRKVSTPPSFDQMPPGPCAEGGGLWTILETNEVDAN